MSTCYKTISRSGSGDYSDLVTAINDIQPSGYSVVTLEVDYDTYSGHFDLECSGIFNIIGNKSTFIFDDICNLNGLYELYPTFSWKSFIFDGIINSDYVISNNINSSFEDIEFIDCASGISNLGTIEGNNIRACGNDDGSFIDSIGSVSLTNSHISHFSVGVAGDTIQLNNSSLKDNIIGINSDNASIFINKSLIKNSPIYLNSGNISSNKNTFVSTDVLISGGYQTVQDTILQTSSEYALIGSGTLTNVDLYSGDLNGLYTLDNIIYEKPLFADETYGDYRLTISPIAGSPCLNIGTNKINDDVTVTVDTNQFIVFDSNNIKTNYIDFIPYIIKQDNTIRFTIEGKEIQFADYLYQSMYKSFSMSQIFNINFSVYDVPTVQSMSQYSSPYPYEWDYATFYTPVISDENKFIIPRSVVNLKDLITSYLPFNYEAIYKDINQTSVKVYNKIDYRGISFDYEMSQFGKAYNWVIEGRNQLLLKQNAFTGETIDSYPLLCPTVVGMVQPKGIIYVGQNENFKHRFIYETDPSIEIVGESEQGYFNWVNTSIDSMIDLRGVLSLNHNLYVTGTEYFSPLESHDEIYTLSGVGIILRYDTTGNYEHFISNLNSTDTPDKFILMSGYLPYDLTVYEDGDLLVSDYNTENYINKYKMKYDYALIESTYDRDIQVLLRENYDDVKTEV